jgi:predicted phage tail protein
MPTPPWTAAWAGWADARSRRLGVANSVAAITVGALCVVVVKHDLTSIVSTDGPHQVGHLGRDGLSQGVAQHHMPGTPVRASSTMSSTIAASNGPLNRHVNAVAMQSSMVPPTAWAAAAASGMAAMLASVSRPTLARLYASVADSQY